MKAGEVMELLKITRATLANHVNAGKVKVIKLPTGRYIYDKDSVYKLYNGGKDRETCIYGRISDFTEQLQLDNQIEKLELHCKSKGYKVSESGIYEDIASGLVFGGRSELNKLLARVIQGKVERVVVLNKEVISKLDFDFIKFLCGLMHCEVEVVEEASVGLLDDRSTLEELLELVKGG